MKISGEDLIKIIDAYEASTQPLSEHKRVHLKSAFIKINPARAGAEIKLWPHEADALFEEFCRLSNYATLLGEPSPADMSGILL